MSLSRKYLMILVACLGLLALTACTREVTTIVQDDPQPMSCFECHDDQNTILVAAESQWANSRHASGSAVHEGTNPSCVRCHASEGLIQYANGEAPAAVTNPTPIHCFSCHQPHTNGNFDLRVTEPQVLVNGVSYDIGEGNLCVVCHQSRPGRDVAVYITEGATNSLSSRYGPHHGPQGDMLFGTNGYEYADYDYVETPGHRTATQDGCVDCHMKAIGESNRVGGHTFAMTYEEEGGGELENLGACVLCHGEDADFDYEGQQTAIDAKVAELQAQLFAAGFVDAAGTPKSVKNVEQDDAGAVWNYMMVKVEDRSHGVHNPAYAMGLLQSSIDHMASRTAK